ncbi:MAG: nuclear transport factor 2 family protein [Mycobacterium sp.]
MGDVIVDTVLEYFAIQALVFEFARRIDVDAAVDNELLFTEDGYFEYDGRGERGRAAIKAAYDRRRALGRRTARHVFTNLVVARGGDAIVRGSSIMMLFGADEPPPVNFAAPIVVADVADEYAVVDGTYLFGRRTIHPVFVDSGRPARLPLAEPRS